MKNGMKLRSRIDINQKALVTCCNYNGGLFELDIKPDLVSVKKILDGDFRGIAKYNGYFIIAENCGNRSNLNIMDSDYRIVEKRLLDSMYDLHGLAINGELAFVVETCHNRIGIYEVSTLSRIEEIAVSTDNHDLHHVNDVFIHNDSLYVSMFHSHISMQSGSILEYSLEDGRFKGICAYGLYHPHSPLYYQGHLYYCESPNSQVKKEGQIVYQGKGYTRGLTISDGKMYVGQSKSRNSSSQNNWVCGIDIYDLKCSRSRFIEIPAEEVYAILAV